MQRPDLDAVLVGEDRGSRPRPSPSPRATARCRRSGTPSASSPTPRTPPGCRSAPRCPTIRLHPSVPVAVPSSARSSEAIPSVSCMPHSPATSLDGGAARSIASAHAPSAAAASVRTIDAADPGPVHSDFSKVPISLPPSPRTVISSPSTVADVGTGEPGVDVLARHHRRRQVAEVDLGPVDLPRARELVAAVAAGEAAVLGELQVDRAGPSPPASTRRRRRVGGELGTRAGAARASGEHTPGDDDEHEGTGRRSSANASYRRR